MFTVLSHRPMLAPKAKVLSIRVASSSPARLRAGGKRFRVGPAPRTIRVRVKPGSNTLLLPLRLGRGRAATMARIVVQRPG